MKLKRLVSAVSALAMSVSAFAGMALTAEAATEVYSFDFNSSEGMPQWVVSRHTCAVVPSGDSTVSASGDTGVLKVITASNSGNGYDATFARSRYDFSSLVEDAESYTVSYRLYFNNAVDVRGVVGLVDTDVRVTQAKSEVSTTGMIGSVGRFSGEDFLRLEKNGNRTFLSNFVTANCWLNVKINVSGDNYSYTVTGDDTATVSGKLSDKGMTKATTLELMSYWPQSTEVLNLDDLTITVEKPDVLPSSAPATPIQDFTGADNTKASLWQAVLTGTGVTYNTIKATATAEGTEPVTNTIKTPTITTTGDVNVFVIVNNKAQDELQSVTVEALNVPEE